MEFLVEIIIQRLATIEKVAFMKRFYSCYDINKNAPETTSGALNIFKRKELPQSGSIFFFTNGNFCLVVASVFVTII